MSNDIVFIVEFGLFAALVLGWGAWQLWSLKREREKDARKAAQLAASPEPPRHPEGQ